MSGRDQITQGVYNVVTVTSGKIIGVHIYTHTCAYARIRKNLSRVYIEFPVTALQRYKKSKSKENQRL